MNSIFKSKIAMLFMAALTMTAFSACSDDDDNDPIEKPEQKPEKPEVKPENGKPIQVMLSRETAYGNDWIYFSLRSGKELTNVTEENHTENLDWDIAFNRYNVRTNSGLSGKGKGGALDTNETDMNKVTTVPDGEFVVDTKAMITESFTGQGITECESTLNECLASAIKFQGPPPSYTPNNHIYIVKTADGKYAKIKILGFHDNKGESGYISFVYVLQADGSKNF